MSKVSEFIARRDDEDLRSVLKTAYGQRFISRMLLSCGVHEMRINFENDNLTYFNAGTRSIGNALLKEVMRIKPEVYALMAKMDMEDEDARKAEHEQDREDE
jgi:hypothetical protein